MGCHPATKMARGTEGKNAGKTQAFGCCDPFSVALEHPIHRRIGHVVRNQVHPILHIFQECPPFSAGMAIGPGHGHRIPPNHILHATMKARRSRPWLALPFGRIAGESRLSQSQLQICRRKHCQVRRFTHRLQHRDQPADVKRRLPQHRRFRDKQPTQRQDRMDMRQGARQIPQQVQVILHEHDVKTAPARNLRPVPPERTGSRPGHWPHALGRSLSCPARYRSHGSFAHAGPAPAQSAPCRSPVPAHGRLATMARPGAGSVHSPRCPQSWRGRSGGAILLQKSASCMATLSIWQSTSRAAPALELASACACARPWA